MFVCMAVLVAVPCTKGDKSEGSESLIQGDGGPERVMLRLGSGIGVGISMGAICGVLFRLQLSLRL